LKFRKITTNAPDSAMI